MPRTLQRLGRSLKIETEGLSYSKGARGHEEQDHEQARGQGQVGDVAGESTSLALKKILIAPHASRL